MDNLEQLSFITKKLNSCEIGNIIAYSYDGGVACLITNKGYVGTIIEGQLEYMKRYEALSDVDKYLKHIKYLSFSDAVFVATESELITFNYKSGDIAIRQDFNTKIIALSWNPAETALVVIDEQNNIYLYLLSANCFLLEQVSHLEASVPVQVMVGWGLQDAQFKGPKKSNEATAAQKMIEVEKVTHDGPPQISWRGNGEMLVVNFKKGDNRVIKVFSQNLQPLSESSFPNLSQPVAFMGQGQYISSCATDHDENNLVIFEKNCKLKEMYGLTETKGKVKKILYHPYMNILAIQTEDKYLNSYLDIYVYTNAKWFLKQQIYHPPRHRICGFQWSNAQENTFTTCKLVVFTNHNIEYYTFRFIFSRCKALATVGVINGKTLNFYMFDVNIIPTPMHHLTLNHTRPINYVLFHPQLSYCLYVDSYHQVNIVKFSRDSVSSTLVTKDCRSDNILNIFYAKWQSDNLVQVVIECENEYEEETKHMTIDKTLTLAIQALKYDRTSRNCILPFNDTSEQDDYMILQNNCVNYIYLTSSSSDHQSKYALGKNREFYVNDKLICNGVTSFYIHGKYLLFTHVECLLYCIRIEETDFTVMLDLEKLFSRSIEQGARIVTCNNACPPQVILILPRGTLDTVSCKLITIDAIEEMLRENNWDMAIDTIRKEKVNWNVLIDLDPHRFCNHLQEFIKAAKNLAVLSNIVNEFEPENNCFKTLYKNYWSRFRRIHAVNKHVVIDKILECLVGTDCINNLACIVLIQQKHISLKQALQSIKCIYNLDHEKYNEICSNVIRQIFIQDNFKDILDATYTLFDVDFLLLVYQNSSEDPSVYQPLITELKTMDVMLRNYQMNVNGHDLDNAVKYLLRCEDLSKSFVQGFICNNKLEKVAYCSLQKNHPHFIWISQLFATRLALSQKYSVAGLVLKRAGLFHEAMNQYIKAHDWQEAINMMNILNLDGIERTTIIDTLATDLVKVNRTEEAVILLELYNKDYKKAVQFLVNYRSFRRALCLAQTHNLTDEIETLILPNMRDHLKVLLEKVERMDENFNKYRNRLQTVREEKMMKHEQLSQGLYDGDELFSETGSTISESSRLTSKTRSSTASSKNRRKEERKKIDLREGGFYEDIALIRTLHLLCSEIYLIGNDVKDICLVAEHGDNLPQLVYKKLASLQQNMMLSATEIWPDIISKDSNSNDPIELAILGNKNDLDPKYWSPPIQLFEMSWHIELF